MKCLAVISFIIKATCSLLLEKAKRIAFIIKGNRQFGRQFVADIIKGEHPRSGGDVF